MCGLAGFVRSGPPEGAGAGFDALHALAGCMEHRGPDDVGVRLAALAPGGPATVGLAATRLAVRDPSPAGHMPMERDGRAVVFNGEIYNAATLRPELERAGWRFHSAADTEVVLAGLSIWGAEALPRLRGMFALAFHDSGNGGSLLLARDPLGIKPLYWTSGPQAVAFASELRALRSAGLLDGRLSSHALGAFLLLGSVPGPLTIYEGARALPPGHLLLIGEDGPGEPRPYWHFPTLEDGPADAAEAAATVRSALEDAVGTHLISDVPLGAFLSGGLDSAAIVALMRRAHDGPVRSCSLTVPGHEEDEGAAARRSAQALGTEHHECAIRMADVVGAGERIFTALDQPSIDGVNTWFVARAAREAGLTVALSGLGADELFGGYDTTFVTLPRLLRTVRVAHRLPGAAAVGAGMLDGLGTQRWRKVADALRRPPALESGYLAVRGLFAPAEVERMLEPGVWDRGAGTRQVLRFLQPETASPTVPLDSRVARMELHGYTAWQLLRDTDVMSMAHGLEVRVPFLDTALVETVLRVPAATRYAGAGTKPLLRRALADLLPAGAGSGPKQGFTLPLDAWLREGLAESLPGGRTELPPPFRAGVLGDARAMLGRGRLHWSRLWALVALRSWWVLTENP
ncbi:MAG: asparagine synthase (glutamine-hydrolyzing) [Gemmatimonadota bacterium]